MSSDQDQSVSALCSTEIYTNVVKGKIVRGGAVMRKMRVAKCVRRIDFCAAEVIKARVVAREHRWDVTVLFRIVIGFDPGDRVVRTIAYFKTHIPLPTSTPSSWYSSSTSSSSPSESTPSLPTARSTSGRSTSSSSTPTSTPTSRGSTSASSSGPAPYRRRDPRIKVEDLECDASVGADDHVIVAELTFKVILLLLEDDRITVCCS